jgi:hypothetical protein
VESALRRTAPGRVFSGAVLSALPLAAGPGVTAGAGAGMKGTAAAKSGVLAACLAPFIGIMAGFAAQWLMIRGGTGRERRAKRIKLIVTWIMVLGFAIGGEYAVRSSGKHFGWNERIYFAAVAGFWWFYAMAMATWIIMIFRRIQAKVQPDEEAGDIRSPATEAMGPGTRAALVAGTHLMLFWAVIFLAWRANDRLADAVIVGLMAVLGVWNFCNLRGLTGLALTRAYIRQLASCCAVMLAVFNLRFDVWVASCYGVTADEITQRFPMWMVPLLTLVLVVWSGILMAVTKPKSNL